MISPTSSEVSNIYRPGRIVLPARELLGVHTSDESFVPVDRLGPGIVEQVGDDGQICVLWLDAEIEIWMDPNDLESLGEQAHLIAVYVCNPFGGSKRVRRSVDTKAGLQHNWTVQLLPDDVARSIRDDGWAWTFQYHPVLKRMDRIHTLNGPSCPPTSDDEAEALTVAELARTGPDIEDTSRYWPWVPADY